MRLKTKDSFWKWVCPESCLWTDIVRLDRELCNRSYDVNWMQEVLEWRYGSQGLVVSGPAGVGKSRLIWVLLRRLLFQEDRSIVVLDEVTFGRYLQAGVFDVQFVEGLVRAQILYLDDVGQTHLTGTGGEYLLHVVEKRVSEYRPVLATTRYAGQELAVQCGGVSTGDSIRRRLNEFCQIVRVESVNYETGAA